MNFSKIITAVNVFNMLLAMDKEIARVVHAGGCLVCGGPLDVSNYARKPRGLPSGVDVRHCLMRDSFCCRDCRKRHTPPSVRFFGRRWYVGVQFVFLSAMMNGLSARRVWHLQNELEVDLRTLQRWRAWWLHEFPQTSFWKGARGVLRRRLSSEEIPGGLAEEFDDAGKVLGFLKPLTTVTYWQEVFI